MSAKSDSTFCGPSFSYSRATIALRSMNAAPVGTWLAGLPLGVLANIDLEEHARTLHPGDLVVFYTDGITEAMNADNDLFGTERLRQAALTAHHGDAQSVMQGILSAVHDFAAGQEQVDDLSMVVLRRV